MKKGLTIDDLKREGMIILEAVMGSTAYGTNTPESDVDIRGVFVQPLDSILGLGYTEQVSDETNDTTYYEIRRFLELLSTNNPNVLELLNVPDDCIRLYDPLMDVVMRRSSIFLTKMCKWSFGGYAISQVRKARSLNKKMNWEDSDTVRKTVLDFCYVIDAKGKGSVPLKDWVDSSRPSFGKEFSFRSVGLSKVDHARDLYNMYDITNEPNYNPSDEFKMGITSDPNTANDVQLTSFSKSARFYGLLSFNKDGYSTHCKRYAEYQDWIAHRNIKRVNMNRLHGKQYDGKNLSHTIRLLMMSNEIASGKGVVVRRSTEEIKKLLAIKVGKYEYDELIREANDLMSTSDCAYDSSTLPDTVPMDEVDRMLIDIRKKKYGIS